MGAKVRIDNFFIIVVIRKYVITTQFEFNIGNTY